jgi:S1-C subfamily serine protease
LVGYPAFTVAKPMTITPAVTLQKYVRKARQHLDISATIRKGNSGGPVLDQDMRVVGVATEGATQEKGNNAVLALSEIISLHKSHFVGPTKP